MLPLSVLLAILLLIPSTRVEVPVVAPLDPAPAMADSQPPSPVISYDPSLRSVVNWREEAVESLDPRPLPLAAVLLQVERPVFSRCVKLNNYWCIKRARWTGEIGGDEEGHTAFGRAGQGADAAIGLLRRYYLDYQRRSALDIVRRWAPAECRTGGGFAGFSAVLAVRGLANTLRARFLASRRSAGRPAKAAGRRAASASRPAVSRVALAPMPSFRVPDIAAGMGERKVAPVRSRAAAAPPRRRSVASAPVSPKSARVTQTAARSASIGCGDEQRIQNYAARMAEAAGLGPADDLRLFDPEGRPLPNLGRVLVAMSSVELGLVRAATSLVDAALLRAAAGRPASVDAPETTPEPRAP